MLKVAKFGGSSMADAKQFEKVRDIVRADPARRVIVVSAAGKRDADDHKLTDLLYLCHAHLQYGVSCESIFQMICERYIAIRDACGLSVDIEAELDVLRQQLRSGISEEELVSRGEYFSALLMADYLGYSFLDAELWVRFQFDGSIDKEASYAALQRLADGRSVVIPGFYGVTPTARSAPSPAAAATLPARSRRRRSMPTCMKTGRTCPASSWQTRASCPTRCRSSASRITSCAS